MITAELSFEDKNVGELIRQINYPSNEVNLHPDIYIKLLPFRIFRIKDHYTEPIPIYGNESWINSTETFPRKYEIVQTLYESEFIKVKLCKNRETNEEVRRSKYKMIY